MQCEPEERAEVDATIKKVLREIQKGFAKFVDMLDLGNNDDNGANLKGFYGSERVNHYFEERENEDIMKIARKLAELCAMFTQFNIYN